MAKRAAKKSTRRKATAKKGVESYDQEDKKWLQAPEADIDKELIEAYRGTVSLSFEPGNHKRVAVKIIDDRRIESLKIVEVG